MNDFALYFSTGWHHIISISALDHILFVLALSAIYLLRNWKQVLVLVTAFTIGHSLTLALSVYDVVRVSDRWVEFLIPCTIIATAVFNFFVKNFSARSLRLNYFLALFFGLIHGMGFANTIRFMLSKDDKIALPLLSFNLGLEVGQIALVSVILSASFLLVDKLKMQRTWWVTGLSAICLLIASQMAVDRWP
ncbi:MAG: HupE/UreJ family protein [Chitinophagaceae bacterium]|nr:HupE/UreJ family protein [Chitinophagaceae bacterium]